MNKANVYFLLICLVTVMLFLLPMISWSQETKKHTMVTSMDCFAEVYNSTRTEKVTIHELAAGALMVEKVNLTEPTSRIDLGESIGLRSTDALLLESVVGAVEEPLPIITLPNGQQIDPNSKEPYIWQILRQQKYQLWMYQNKQNRITLHQGTNKVIKLGSTQYFLTEQNVPIGSSGTTVLADTYEYDANPWWTRMEYKKPSPLPASLSTLTETSTEPQTESSLGALPE